MWQAIGKLLDEHLRTADIFEYQVCEAGEMHTV